MFAEWKAEPGSKVIAGKFPAAADRAPVLAERLNSDLEIPKTVAAMTDRDQGISSEYSLPMRQDVQNLWRIIGGRSGWLDRLRAARARGKYLPAAVLAALGLQASAQNGDGRSS
jgi:hypothetical protein